MYKFSFPLPVLFALLLGCDAHINTSLKMDLYMDRFEATKLIAKSWLLIPFVPTHGMAGKFVDYGDFEEKIEDVRPSQKVTLFGRKLKMLSKIQIEKHKEYVKYVRENHRIPDSLVFSLVGDYNARVLITPVIFSHQITQSKDGIYQRRMAIILKAWDIDSRIIILDVTTVSIHSSEKKEKLVSGAQLFKAGLKAISEKLLYHPLAGLTPQSKPDF